MKDFFAAFESGLFAFGNVAGRAGNVGAEAGFHVGVGRVEFDSEFFELGDGTAAEKFGFGDALGAGGNFDFHREGRAQGDRGDRVSEFVSVLFHFLRDSRVSGTLFRLGMIKGIGSAGYRLTAKDLQCCFRELDLDGEQVETLCALALVALEHAENHARGDYRPLFTREEIAAKLGLEF